MPKSSNFHIIAADTEWDVNTKGEKSYNIALWLKVHHAKLTEDRVKIQSVTKEAGGAPVLEKHNIIYVIPES